MRIAISLAGKLRLDLQANSKAGALKALAHTGG
jgi:hypothetical protein